jgi:capsular exopolysaccharide synthesis family protein
MDIQMFGRNKAKDSKTKERSSVVEEYLRLLTTSTEIGHAYHTLLNSFFIRESGRPPKTLLVTSTQPQEGKTTVAINLALIAMLAGLKVLLVDADLRKPRVHDIFNLDNKRGLGDLLSGTVGVDDVLQMIELTYDVSRKSRALGVITSGGGCDFTNTPLTMDSARLKAFFEQSSPRFDMVVLDSPPVLSVSDPLLLAPFADGIILVLKSGIVTEKDAKLAKERLEQAGGHLLGVVMNRFNEALHGPGVHPYKNYYISS